MSKMRGNKDGAGDFQWGRFTQYGIVCCTHSVQQNFLSIFYVPNIILGVDENRILVPVQLLKCGQTNDKVNMDSAVSDVSKGMHARA